MVTVSAARACVGTTFRPGVTYTVRDDVLPALEGIVLTKSEVA